MIDRISGREDWDLRKTQSKPAVPARDEYDVGEAALHPASVGPIYRSMIQRAFDGGALALFALRVGAVREGKQFEAVSREGALVVNNLLLSAILGIVLVGTLYPLGVEAVKIGRAHV